MFATSAVDELFLLRRGPQARHLGVTVLAAIVSLAVGLAAAGLIADALRPPSPWPKITVEGSAGPPPAEVGHQVRIDPTVASQGDLVTVYPAQGVGRSLGYYLYVWSGGEWVRVPYTLVSDALPGLLAPSVHLDDPTIGFGLPDQGRARSGSDHVLLPERLPDAHYRLCQLDHPGVCGQLATN